MIASNTTHQSIETHLSCAENNALFRARPGVFIAHAQQALKESVRVKDIHAASRSKIAIAMHALDDCAYDKALKLSSEACRGFEILGDEVRRLDALEKVGKAHMLLGQYGLSLETLTHALRLSNNVGASQQGILYYNLATLCLYKGDLSSSLEYSLYALQTLENTNERVLSFVLYNIGYILSLRKNDGLAESYLSKAEHRAISDMKVDSAATDVTAASPFDLMLVADIHALREDYRAAFQSYQKAYGLFKDFRFHSTEAECLMDMGRSALHFDKGEETESYFSEARRIANGIGNKYLIARSNIAYGEFYLATDRILEAETTLMKVVSYARTNDNHALQLSAYETLAVLEEGRKNWSASIRYQREVNEIVKSQWFSHEMRVTLPTSTVHATSVHTYENMLRSKSDRIGTLEADLASQKGLLLALRSKLREVTLAQDEQKTLGVRMLLNSLSEHLEMSEHDVKLRDNLKTLNESFIEELRMKYSSLTAAELQVCSVLALGFRGEEIEELLSCSTRTLENHRFRIRRKMQLKRNEKLEEVLRKLRSESVKC